MEEETEYVNGIEVLAGLCDEHGLQHWDSEAMACETHIFVDKAGNPHECWEAPSGMVNVVISMTPEQAVMLGTETCHIDVLNTGDCAGYECSEYIMHCKGCGHEFGNVLYNEDGDVWMSEPPNYCPNCGRKVVDE